MGQIYLVNISKGNSFNFTIKKTQVKNGTVTNYSTEIIYLAPGDEAFLGYSDSTSTLIFPLIKKKILKTEHYVPYVPIRPTREMKSILNGKFTKRDKIMEKFVIEKIIENDTKLYNENLVLSMYPDTIIKGEKLKFWFETTIVIDSLNPLPQDKFKNRFEVTGQVKQKIY